MRIMAAVPLTLLLCTVALAQEPQPFTPDANTRLLYHLDEAAGDLARDASGRGQDGTLQGPAWAKGRFGGGLHFDGTDDAVFLAKPEGLYGLRQITVECWFRPEYASGRRFLIGHDVGFHFEVDDAVVQSISLYNQGGGVPNAEGKPHQQVASGGTPVRSGRWHHLAITYDGGTVSYFLDGALIDRKPGPRDFTLGVPSRGLWLGCYVGMDYWYSGTLDEVRVSDCVRYDPEGKMKKGDRVFGADPAVQRVGPAPTVRKATRQDLAALRLTLRKLHGAPASGLVYLRAPGKPAAVVGEYQVAGENGQTTTLSLDVSDEYSGEGAYVIGLVPQAGGCYALVSAELSRGDKQLAAWSGERRSRATFHPPVLVVLRVGAAAPASGPLLLTPQTVDRSSGNLQLDTSEEDQPPVMLGDGEAEWWLDLPRAQTYRVYLRYSASAPTPCDLVIDGQDLHPYNMCARSVSGLSSAREAFWEYQGTVRLGSGSHWLRLQDVLPNIVALRLVPVAAVKPAPVPYASYPVPAPDAVGRLSGFTAQPLLGSGTSAATAAPAGLQFAATFTNADPAAAFAGDCTRFTCPVKWDLRPYGRLRLTYQGTGGEHVAALVLVDAKGDEKLLWRQRDLDDKPYETLVPLDFEGNDVFDPSRIAAVCVELDEGNANPTAAGEMRLTLSAALLERRDTLAALEGYAQKVQAAVRAAAQRLASLAGQAPATLRSPGFRPWTKPVVPETHPLFAATEPKPVTRETLGYGLHSTGARDISDHALRMFHEDYDFGDICWPHIGILPQRRNFKTDADYQAALSALEKQLAAVKQRNLYLFDIWGYVPNGEAGPTPQVTPEHDAILKRVMGDRFLGYDNGEQDGRYIGSYAGRGPAANRRAGWDDFVAWDKGICADSMNYMNATGSLNFSHYYGERGCRTLGLETAQGLPSDTLMFAFLRGASKQYGRLTTQATSIWNRYGYNMYGNRKTEGANGYGLGPNKGCSLSLHKRLFFQSYTGGDSIVGSETSQFTADTLPDGKPELSPLGRQHLEIMQWVRKHPDRGVMYTPVAFMLDFHNGWNMPRHLYRGDKYKIWGKFPYEKGDYLIDNIFRMVWPGYEDCSYSRNERGFICDTPYGDLFDVVTNRCHPTVLAQYTTLMLLGDVELTPEVQASLRACLEAGGDVIMDAANARQLPSAVTGLALGETAQACATARVGSTQTWAELPYTYTVAKLQGGKSLLLSERGDPILTSTRVGKGRLLICLADRWMTDQLAYADPKLLNMESPYRLLNGPRVLLGEYFASLSPAATTPAGLNVRVNCYGNDPRRLLVALTNNDLFADWHGKLQLRGVTARSVRDLRREKALPADAALTVPAGDVVLLDVRLK